MRKIFTSFLAVFICVFGIAQENEILPRYMTAAEREAMSNYSFPVSSRGIDTPPAMPNLRTMAEWEEIQALTVTWRSYPGILKQIVRAAKEECRVLIFCENCTQTLNFLMGNEAGGPFDNLANVELVEAESNSIWIRDYGANTVYGNRVDSLVLVDWIYNRPRPDDDVIPEVLADYLGIDLYTTTSAPADLVNTGGNFMNDGQGTAFASELILEENEAGNPYNVTAKSEEDIDNILADFQGISRYIKMEALQYDIINHIDMHMKIIDEETLLVGEYPDGIADGPQINANIDYVVNTFLSYYGNNYEVVRIPMPPSSSGLYPDDNPAGHYRTYTNGVFVNKTFIYPSYREEYDTTAARIYSEILPGYTMVPIDCDNSPEQIIAAAGAIHCITHSVGVNDPLLIVHQPLPDTEDDINAYAVNAEIAHKTGIASATLYWRVQGEAEYIEAPMLAEGDDIFAALIPAQAVGTIIEYYISAEAENGKTLSRPIVAPEGFWEFEVLGGVVTVNDENPVELRGVYPNPAVDLVSIPILSSYPLDVNITLKDITGKKIDDIYRGRIQGDRRISYLTGQLNSGVYLIVVESDFGVQTTKLLINR